MRSMSRKDPGCCIDPLCLREPANTAHFAYTTQEGSLVYIFGNGPTDTRYVEESQQPRER